jgi:hypothetical protein
MHTAEIAQLEDARRSPVAYAVDTAEAEIGSGFLLGAMIWTIGFAAIVGAVLFALS